MINLTEENLKAIKAATFPKVARMSQYFKKNPVDTKDMGKILKSLVLNRDFILNDNTVMVNLACIANLTLDKAKLIKLLRLACDIRPQIAFYGWCSLMIRLDVQFGSVACVKLTTALKNFIIKHCNAYAEYQKKAPIVWVKPTKELLEKRYDSMLSNTETDKLRKMWVLVDGIYYIHDDFYEALINYGYTKDQIRGVVHRCTKTEDYSLIPLYIRKKYLVIPNGGKALEKIIY